MRCPKCGFISFDNLTACAKCGKDIADVASELQGTSIKVEAPMFLSTALASYADREAYYGDNAIDDSGGIDFSMEEQTAEEEVIEMDSGAADIDFSMETETAAADISLAEPEEEGSEPAVDFTIEAEMEGKGAPGASDESFEELELVNAVDVEDDGGLEFDLEDFIDDLDNDDSDTSDNGDADSGPGDEDK
jgi:hypothetical protein